MSDSEVPCKQSAPQPRNNDKSESYEEHKVNEGERQEKGDQAGNS